jgi:hypothetical protein
MYIVNDGSNRLNLSIDLSEWMNVVVKGTQVPVESVQDGYWGEVSNMLTVPSINEEMRLNVDPYSTHRLTIQTGEQKETRFNASLTCTVQAGENSDKTQCGDDDSIYVSTSNTAEHKKTSVALIQFKLGYPKQRFRSFLKVYLNFNLEQGEF